MVAEALEYCRWAVGLLQRIGLPFDFFILVTAGMRPESRRVDCWSGRSQEL